MSSTLTYGRILPATGDAGSTWFPALETNIALDDAHNHNGVNSPALTPVAFTKFSSNIVAADWGSDGGGNYSVLVTVPSGISTASSPFNDVSYYDIFVSISTAGATLGDRVYPQIERESATTFTVRVNDNTLDLLIRYV